MDWAARISEMITRSMKAHRVVGASVAIVNGGEPDFVAHCGYADKSAGAPVADGTIFKIGSITKVFTASAVMRLAERGLVDIDRPLGDYLPDFSVRSRFPEARPITVRDVLCHHAGLPCDNLRGYFTEDLEAFHSVLPFLKESCAVCPPGAMFYYSNLGYELLGVLIARISGVPFHEYVDGTLLPGLGMHDSAVSLSPDQRSRLSRPYRNGGEADEPSMKTVPEGGIHATARDMLQFMKAIVSGGTGLFAKEATLAAMTAAQYPGNPRDMSFTNGLGWFVGRPGLDHGGKVIWHDGGTPNFFSLVVLIPERRLGITLLTNSTTGALMNHTLSVDILRLLLAETHRVGAPPARSRKPAPLSAEAARCLAGRYFTISGVAEVAASGRRLRARLSSGTFRLEPHHDGWFGLALLVLGFLPLRLKQLALLRLGLPLVAGERLLALEQLGLRSPQGTPVKPLHPPAAWKARAGAYVCVNEERPRLKSLALRLDRYGLSLEINTDKMGRLRPYLETLNDGEAVTLGLGRYAGETVFASGDTLTVFGLEFRKVE